MGQGNGSRGSRTLQFGLYQRLPFSFRETRRMGQCRVRVRVRVRVGVRVSLAGPSLRTVKFWVRLRTEFWTERFWVRSRTESWTEVW